MRALRFIFIINLLTSYQFIEAEEEMLKTHIQTINLQEPGTIDITLEFAKRPNEISWGLIQRPFLPQDHGMLFFLSKPTMARFWSFNSLIDLSVAFIDKDQVIRKIQELKAYPEKMDPGRPVRSLEDFKKYPPNDPIVLFFEENSISPAIPIDYALQMSKNWFSENSVKSGDVLLWNELTLSGTILHTMDISKYSENVPVILKFKNASKLAFWLPEGTQDHDIAFLNVYNHVIKTGLLKAGKNFEFEKIPVIYTRIAAQSVLIAPEGWLLRNGVIIGIKLINP